MTTPTDLVRKGRSKEAFEAVLKEGSSREADQAFHNEVQPLLQNFISKAQAQIEDMVSDIVDGKFPNSRVEYAVMRYKPMSMTDEEFLEGLYDPYDKWLRSTRIAG